MFAWHRPILTQQRRIPWHWALLINLPWFGVLYHEFISNTAITFTLRKFIEDPRLIAFLGSVNIAFNFMVGALCNYLSDRVWTRWGRRRPFLLAGMTGSMVILFLLPLAPNLAVLAVGIVLYQFFVDVATPLEPLTMEVIPPAQRGRAQAMRMVLQTLSVIYFYNLMFAHWDEVHATWDWLRQLGVEQITGEQLTYWAGSAIMLGLVLLLGLNVRELPGARPAWSGRFSLPEFLRDLFSHRQSWLVYLLFISPTLVHGVWGQFQALLVTDQLGYSKQAVAAMGTAGMLLQLVIATPILGWLADRPPRIPPWAAALTAATAVAGAMALARAPWAIATEVPTFTWMMAAGGLVQLATLAAVIALLPLLARLTGGRTLRVGMFLFALGGTAAYALVMWLVLHVIAAGGRPTLVTLFLLGQVGGVVASCGWVVMGPMLFDYIPRDWFGTVSSGMGFVNGVIRFGIMNLAGFWVFGWTQLFAPGGTPVYSSCFILQALLGVPAVGMVLFFAWQLRRGKVDLHGAGPPE